mmetsp:Transcript_1225/g.1735  ORF Transcript_1225/g.1735 Transcript_1225/m.1735 type:complete len:316 (-) Transcript_1225:63-1010(-)
MAASTNAISKSANMITNPAFRWAAGGWSFFIAENWIISENRSKIINVIGEDNYHYMYGTISTAAMASIGYGYLYKVKNSGPFLWNKGMPIPLTAKLSSFLVQALAFTMVSQTAPKLQIPVEYAYSPADDGDSDNNNHSYNTNTTATEQNSKWKVRCPFDFTDSNSNGNDQIRGIERITRHPGLWGFGLWGVGNALLTPSLPTRIWMSMPIMVALIGGAHADSRHKRGLGGTLDPRLEEQTSNIPFLAIITGRQGKHLNMEDEGKEECDCDSPFMQLLTKEFKPLNAFFATGFAALMVVTRSRAAAAVVTKNKFWR